MTMQADTGKYGTGFYSGDAADRRLVIDMSKQIHMLSPTDTPFYVMLANARKETAAQPKFEWMEDEYFVLRSFKADWHQVADDNGRDAAFLKLKNPNDLQGLEAPPYLSTAADYAIEDGDTLYVKLSDGTYDLYVVIEKAGVELAGTWTSYTMDTAADAYLSTHDATWAGVTSAAEAAAITGYTIPIAVGAAPSFDDATTFSTISTHGAGILKDYAIVLGATATSVAGDQTAANSTWNSDKTDITVTVMTPNAPDAGGFYEGSGLPEESRKGIRLFSNYTQIFKTPYSITNTAIATSYVGGDELARIRGRNAIKHKRDIEQTLLFQGAKSISTDAESPLRRTQGLGIGQTDYSGFIKTHSPGAGTVGSSNDYCITNLGANFYTQMNEALENIFSDAVQGGSKKVMLCSQKWLGAFTARAVDASSGTPPVLFHDTPGSANMTYGLRVGKYQSPFGLVDIVGAPVLRGEWEDYAVILDFSNIAMKVLPSRDTHIVTNAQGPDEDGLKEYLITELGLQVMHEQTHGILKLVAAAS
jgi:hypothetical protein